MFPFKDVPDEEWLGNQKFLSHTLRSFESLSSMIDLMGNPVMLKLVLTKIRKFHGQRNIKEKEFTVCSNLHIRKTGQIIFKQLVRVDVQNVQKQNCHFTRVQLDINIRF